MQKLSLIFGFSLISMSLNSWASINNVCDLINTPIDSQILQKISDNDLISYKNKLNTECELSKKYSNIQKKLTSNHSIQLTDIAEYQAIRFVERDWLSRAEAEQKPIEIIYQLFKSDYQKPFSEQSSVTWDDWALGVKQLDQTISNFKAGVKFDLNALKKIHRGLFPFYPLITEKGDFSHDPNPGVLKPTSSSDIDNYWWSIEDINEVEEARKIVDAENKYYSQLGLLTPTPPDAPEHVGLILSLREADNRKKPGEKVMALFSGNSMVNRQNVELILEMVHNMMSQAVQGSHMVWKGRLFSPGELAYFTQQAYVRVHPFYEGNGRTSRFLQELILTSFNLPHGASGDLMDKDALSLHSKYYQVALEKNNQLLEKMNQCLNEYSSFGKNLKTVDSVQLSYSCRLLQDRSAIWSQLRKTNEVDQKIKYDQELKILSELNNQNELSHQQELKRRKKKNSPDSSTNTTTPENECSLLDGSEKERCERFKEIRDKLGV